MEKNTTELIRELSQYCFKKQIHLLILTEFERIKTHSIELMDIHGQSTVKIILYKNSKEDDAILFEKINNFLNNLKATL